MAHWVLYCPDCKREFPHSEISANTRRDPFVGNLNKPEFPRDGVKLACPHCKKTSRFQRYQLTLQR